MNVPILKFFGYSINKAIGSAAAIGFLIALFGATGFFVSGSYLKTNLMFQIKTPDEAKQRSLLILLKGFYIFIKLVLLKVLSS